MLRIGCAFTASLVAPALRAHEFFSTNLTVIHPWTPPSIEGATTAIVSMDFRDVVRTDRLIGVMTPVAASAELGGVVTGPGGRIAAGPELDFEIRAGEPSALRAAGVYLRLVGLRHPLLEAREYPMTLIFANGGAVRAALLTDHPEAE